MYKVDFALNNPRGLIYHITQLKLLSSLQINKSGQLKQLN